MSTRVTTETNTQSREDNNREESNNNSFHVRTPWGQWNPNNPQGVGYPTPITGTISPGHTLGQQPRSVVGLGVNERSLGEVEDGNNQRNPRSGRNHRVQPQPATPPDVATSR
jgi:hypothetical protein